MTQNSETLLVSLIAIGPILADILFCCTVISDGNRPPNDATNSLKGSSDLTPPILVLSGDLTLKREFVQTIRSFEALLRNVKLKMHVNNATLIVICLLFGAFLGTTSGCNQGTNDHYCEHGARLIGWGIIDGFCEFFLRDYIPYPEDCAGCTIHTENGYIEVWTPEGGFYRCDYGNEKETKTCEAYCVDTESNRISGTYECLVADDSREPCSCDVLCTDNNNG